MKKLLILMLFTIITLPSFAQEEETLLGGKDISHGGYGALDLKWGKAAGGGAVFVGGRGGWIINSTFSIGGGGCGLATRHIFRYDELNPEHGYNGDAKLNMGWGGIFLEYTNNSKSLLHFTANTMIGWGYARIYEHRSDDWWDENEWENELDDTDFMVIEPGATVEMNITNWFRLSGGISWRFITNFEMTGFESSDFDGMNANLSFKFGKF